MLGVLKGNRKLETIQGNNCAVNKKKANKGTKTDKQKKNLYMALHAFFLRWILFWEIRLYFKFKQNQQAFMHTNSNQRIYYMYLN